MYEPKAEVSKIKFTSRAAIKAGDNYFTVEATEERDIYPDMKGVDLAKEWDALCDSTNSVIDAQVDDIYEHLIKKK